jgi:uncharacterized membrane protein YebE (DUF533 family)
MRVRLLTVIAAATIVVGCNQTRAETPGTALANPVSGAPAAGGAIIGALVGGKKGALVGTAIGGGAGTAAVLSTRGREVHLAKGAALTVRLTAPVTVVVKG